MISSISKLAFILVLIQGCSSHDQAQERQKEIKEKTTSSEKVEKPLLLVGPTRPEAADFIDKTSEYGLEGVTGTHFYAVDLNNNGYSDMIVLPNHHSIPDFYYFNPVTKKFEEDTSGALPQGQRASFLLVYDFDKDGVRDLITVTLNQKTALNAKPIQVFKGELKNKRIYFKEVEGAIADYRDPVSSLIPLDYNLDGWLDLFQANWFDTRKEGAAKPRHDRFYVGQAELKFEEKTALLLGEDRFDDDYKIHINARPTSAASICDVNQDGFPDLLTSSYSGEKNKMWVNLFQERYSQRAFENFAQESGYDQDGIGELVPRGGGRSLFAICTDYNNNGFIDILKSELTHSYDSETYDRSSILTAKSNRFPPEYIRTPYEVSNSQERWTHSAKRGLFADFNNDGLIDILADNSSFPPLTRIVLFMQAQDHAFEDEATKRGVDILNPSGSITVDLNKDGKLDIITGQVNIRDARIKPRIYVFENNIKANQRRSIRFFPKGLKSNPHGLGAKIVFKTSTRTQTRFVSYTEGNQPSQNEEGLLFGIQKGDFPLSVKVTWPILNDEQKPHVTTYNLRGLKFKQSLDLVLCEDKKMKQGRLANCLP